MNNFRGLTATLYSFLVSHSKLIPPHLGFSLSRGGSRKREEGKGEMCIVYSSFSRCFLMFLLLRMLVFLLLLSLMLLLHAVGTLVADVDSVFLVRHLRRHYREEEAASTTSDHRIISPSSGLPPSLRGLRANAEARLC